MQANSNNLKTNTQFNQISHERVKIAQTKS